LLNNQQAIKMKIRSSLTATPYFFDKKHLNNNNKNGKNSIVDDEVFCGFQPVHRISTIA